MRSSILRGSYVDGEGGFATDMVVKIDSAARTLRVDREMGILRGCMILFATFLARVD